MTVFINCDMDLLFLILAIACCKNVSVFNTAVNTAINECQSVTTTTALQHCSNIYRHIFCTFGGNKVFSTGGQERAKIHF